MNIFVWHADMWAAKNTTNYAKKLLEGNTFELMSIISVDAEPIMSQFEGHSPLSDPSISSNACACMHFIYGT